MKTPAFLFMACLLCCACKKTFDYSPHEIRLSSSDENLNAKNISRIEAQPVTQPLKFIVIGDPQRAYDELDDFVTRVNTLPGISFVVINGDITDFGLNSEYEWIARTMSRLTIPYVAVIGNHDMLGNGPEVYARMFGPDTFSFAAGRSKFICLNSNSLERNYDGTLPNLPWLGRELNAAAAYNNIFVFAHIAPFSYGFDSTMVGGYTSLLAGSGKVRLSIHAHIDQYFHEVHYNDGVEYLVVNTVSKRRYAVVTVNNESYQIEEDHF